MGFTGNFWVDVHTVWRWVMLAVALVTVVKALIGWLGKQPWSKLDDRLGMFFTIAVDIQFLLGLILWFVGPFQITNAAALMQTELGRFYMIEHPVLMLIALASGPHRPRPVTQGRHRCDRSTRPLSSSIS